MWSLHNFTVGLLMWINTNFVDFWRVSLLQNIGIHLQVRSSLWIQIPACQPLGEMPHTRYSESQDSENDGTHRFRHLMFSGIRFCSLRSLQKTSGGSWDFYEPKNVQNLSTKSAIRENIQGLRLSMNDGTTDEWWRGSMDESLNIFITFSRIKYEHHSLQT